VRNGVHAGPSRGDRIKTIDRNGDGPTAASGGNGAAREAAVDATLTANADQTASDSDQSAADADQTSSDADHTASESDQASADKDQEASDRDQATADRERAADPNKSAADEDAYDASREERETGSSERLGNRLRRADTARERDMTATRRDRIAEARDEAGRTRDSRAGDLAKSSKGANGPLIRQLERLSLEAASDRARAAEDRERAARDRSNAARERAGLEEELRSAHLDDLTGAYRREMGRLALSNEIDRARRSDGRLVLAFVDVDGLKAVNDRDGHAAGDRVLRTVVDEIRSNLRSFDPIIRYGGDEFVCGLGGTDRFEVEQRFDTIATAIEAGAHVDISVGLATLEIGDTADMLTERADAAMLEVKARHHSRT
jgi:diguanylate cyclase (GGDEF)-like protein